MGRWVEKEKGKKKLVVVVCGKGRNRRDRKRKKKVECMDVWLAEKGRNGKGIKYTKRSG